ncbi:MAG: hypothetical protein Tsb0014_24160 [Pleurocapsa sp.]
MQQKTQKTNILGKIFALFCIGFLLSILQGNLSQQQLRSHLQTVFRYLNQSRSPVANPEYTPSIYSTPPLAMKGGDPYIRALMRTITASESNVARPYNVIYGGKLIEDLSLHPEECVAIIAGPNVGRCSTAAGRYQMLDFTWENQAKRYHPKPSGFWRWKSYSFEPEYQDKVVHDWLKDKKAWNADLPQLLREGEINTVLRLLSGTWTSLGYGIETNAMSPYLPKIYHNMLQEELNS